MTHNPTPLDKLDQIAAEIRELLTLAEQTDNPAAAAQFTRQLAEIDQIRARISEAADDADACDALESEFDR